MIGVHGPPLGLWEPHGVELSVTFLMCIIVVDCWWGPGYVDEEWIRGVGMSYGGEAG